jgi:hypothetical protein
MRPASLPPLEDPKKATRAMTSQEKCKRHKVLQGRKNAKKRKTKQKEQKLDISDLCQKVHQK